MECTSPKGKSSLHSLSDRHPLSDRHRGQNLSGTAIPGTRTGGHSSGEWMAAGGTRDATPASAPRPVSPQKREHSAVCQTSNLDRGDRLKCFPVIQRLSLAELLLSPEFTLLMHTPNDRRLFSETPVLLEMHAARTSRHSRSGSERRRRWV